MSITTAVKRSGINDMMQVFYQMFNADLEKKEAKAKTARVNQLTGIFADQFGSLDATSQQDITDAVYRAISLAGQNNLANELLPTIGHLGDFEEMNLKGKQAQAAKAVENKFSQMLAPMLGEGVDLTGFTPDMTMTMLKATAPEEHNVDRGNESYVVRRKFNPATKQFDVTEEKVGISKVGLAKMESALSTQSRMAVAAQEHRYNMAEIAARGREDQKLAMLKHEQDQSSAYGMDKMIQLQSKIKLQRANEEKQVKYSSEAMAKTFGTYVKDKNRGYYVVDQKAFAQKLSEERKRLAKTGTQTEEDRMLAREIDRYDRANREIKGLEFRESILDPTSDFYRLDNRRDRHNVLVHENIDESGSDWKRVWNKTIETVKSNPQISAKYLRNGYPIDNTSFREIVMQSVLEMTRSNPLEATEMFPNLFKY